MFEVQKTPSYQGCDRNRCCLDQIHEIQPVPSSVDSILNNWEFKLDAAFIAVLSKWGFGGNLSFQNGFWAGKRIYFFLIVNNSLVFSMFHLGPRALFFFFFPWSILSQFSIKHILPCLYSLVASSRNTGVLGTKGCSKAPLKIHFSPQPAPPCVWATTRSINTLLLSFQLMCRVMGGWMLFWPMRLLQCFLPGLQKQSSSGRINSFGAKKRFVQGSWKRVHSEVIQCWASLWCEGGEPKGAEGLICRSSSLSVALSHLAMVKYQILCRWRKKRAKRHLLLSVKLIFESIFLNHL